MQRRQIIKIVFVFLLLLLAACCDIGLAQNLYYEKAIYTDEYGLSFYPDYPPTIGKTVTLRLRTFAPAQKVTLITDRFVKIPMTYRDGHWWARYKIPDNYQEGGHFFTVWIKYIRFDPKGFKPDWSESKVWYKAFEKVEIPRFPFAGEAIPLPLDISAGADETLPPIVTGEAVTIEVASPETGPLAIKGSQSITFKSRSLSGSKEGYAPGSTQTREETLRLNIAGKAADTDIEATFYRTSALGVSQIGEREEEIAIKMRRGSTEVYLGDFTADLTETEFAGLDKEMQGEQVKGDYQNWGFTALYSSPKGESKFTQMYGDGTQGPYNLTFSPVVIGSEKVYLDGVLQKRGDDYNVDYNAGTVTFIKEVIDPKSILRIYYDYRHTVYQHATYGWRSYCRPSANLKLAVTYLNDSDSLAGAQETRNSMSQEAVDPQGHYVIGTDGSYVSENLSAQGEVAYSAKDLNLLSAASTKETGRAGKFRLSSSLGPFGFKSFVKKVGSNFQAIADPDPKQDVWEYGGGLSFRPNSLFGSLGDYAYQKYAQSGVVYENLYKTAKAQLTPEKLPSLEYQFSETDESNDPVTGSSIRRVITKNSVETIHQVGFWSTSLKGTLEKWLRRSPSEEVTDYRKVNLGLATIGLEKITFTSNVELENRREPAGLEPYKRTYNLNLAATPSREFFVSSSLQLIDDSQEGHTNVAELVFRAEPSKIFKAEGKYTINSLLEEFPVTPEAVSKQIGSLSFDLRPDRALRFRYIYKPNFTRLIRTGGLTYNNEQHQAEVNYLPVKYALLGLIYKVGHTFNIYKDDYPDYSVRDNSQDTDSVLYTCKLAPFKIMSNEFNYQVTNSDSRTLASTQEPYIYTKGKEVGRKFDAIVKTSLSEKFSIDTRYIFQKTDQGSGESRTNIVDTKSHTASLKGIWNVNQSWTFSLSTAYTRTTDYLLSQVTYTLSPGVGIIYRLSDKFRVDFEYTHSKSYAGEETELNKYLLQTKYALSDFVDFILRVDQENSRSPDYNLTDVTANLEINL